jgi:16S rRNA (cytosine967-C5)-methyltransferase
LNQPTIKSGTLRAVAAKAIARVNHDGTSLTEVMRQTLEDNDFSAEDNSLLQALCYGTIRFMPRWNVIIRGAMDKPLKASEAEIYALIALGLFQLQQSRIPPHAAISETVAATQILKKHWAKGLVNAILRRCQREPEWQQQLLEKEIWAEQGFPRWIWKRLKKDWPDHYQEIMQGSNLQAPMTIRVNQLKHTRDEYLEQLSNVEIAATKHPLAKQALVLEHAVAVDRLPDFQQGSCSVQDAAAQMAAQLLDVGAGMHVLDACAAPGGKTGHILEQLKDGHCVAIDNDAKRLVRVAENMQRLSLTAEIITADAGDTATWWDGKPFDRILLDAPCSGSGVIRRHPDIKILRRAEDIVKLKQIQQQLLASLWLLLKPGGKMLYATCSVFAEENEQQMAQFFAAHENAKEIKIDHPAVLPVSLGWQIAPGWENMDGFYFCLFEKTEKDVTNPVV